MNQAAWRPHLHPLIQAKGDHHWKCEYLADGPPRADAGHSPSIEPTVSRFDRNEHSALHGLVRTRTDSTIKTSTTPGFFLMFLYYLPPLYLCTVNIGVLRIIALVIGFIVGLFHLRWEFFKGFLFQIGLCIPGAVLWCVAGAAGLFGDLSDFGEAMQITLLATLILLFNYHMKSLYGRALGASYGAPLGYGLLLFGLSIGAISMKRIVL